MDTQNPAVDYREIPGFPGYFVGTDGSVWNSWVTCRSGRSRGGRWRQMKLANNRRGYLSVNLTPESGKPYKTLRVHRLVLETFIGPCPPGMECRHLNGCKTDCRLENLAWGTPEENRADNRHLDAYQAGEKHSQAKLTEADVRSIRDRYATGKVLLRQLAAEHNVAMPTIHAIISRRSWKHIP